MSDAKLAIANVALTNAGFDAVTALSGPEPAIVAILSNYDQIVRCELETGNWTFAVKEDSPSLLTATSDEPLKYRWQLPTDVLKVLAVLYNGYELDGEDFAKEGAVIRTAYNTDIKVRYAWRPDEEAWSASFCKLVSQRLEAVLLRSREDRSGAMARDRQTDSDAIVAKHADSTQRRNRPLGAGRIADRRRGRIPQE